MNQTPARIIKKIKEGIDIGSRGIFSNRIDGPKVDPFIRIIESDDKTYVHIQLNKKMRFTLFNKIVSWGIDCDNNSWRSHNQCCNGDCVAGTGKGRVLYSNIKDPNQQFELTGHEIICIKEYKNRLRIDTDKGNTDTGNLEGIIDLTTRNSNVNRLCKFPSSPRPCTPRCQRGKLKPEHTSISNLAN